MDASTALIEEAQQIALNADARARRLQAELDDVEAKKVAINSDLQRAKGTAKRILNYQPRLGSKFYCPRCWVRDEVRTELSMIPGTDSVDLMRCDTCSADWEIPLR